MLGPVADILIDRARPKAGERILDVGCGAGATTRARQKVGPSGHVLGIDISAPMLARARKWRQGHAGRFRAGGRHRISVRAASFDLLASRFGVMFFAEPALSFANLRKALKPSGRLAFACWREPRDNPFFMAPLQAVYKHAPKLPKPGPEDPGPFSFASEARVKRVLGEAGFTGIRDGAVRPVAGCRGRAGARRGGRRARSRSDPPAVRWQEQPDEVRAAARQSIREALAAFATAQTVLLGAAIWIVTASAGA